MKEKVAAELKQNFRPEFLNRIDATVVFRSLTVEEIAQIVDLMLARVRDQLRAQQMQLEVTPAAKEHIIKLGYDVAYGARPLSRVIQNMIEDVLAEHLLLGKYEPGSMIVVDKDPEAGLDIRLAEHRAPRSRRGEHRRPSGGLAMARPASRFVCQSLRGIVPALGRAMSRLRGLEHAGRDGRPRAVAFRARRRPAARSVATSPSGLAAISEADLPRLASGSASSTGCSAAGSCPDRWSCSAASRASASRRSCSRQQPA